MVDLQDKNYCPSIEEISEYVKILFLCSFVQKSRIRTNALKK